MVLLVTYYVDAISVKKLLSRGIANKQDIVLTTTVYLLAGEPVPVV